MDTFAAIIGLLTGAFVGIAPCVVGAVKGKLGLGILAFFTCMFAGLIGGLIVSVPTMAVFLYFILKKPKTAVVATEAK